MRIEPKPSLDTSVFYEIIESGDTVARIKLAVQLSAFVADGENSEGERNQVVPVILKLCVDPVREVRQTLVNGFVGVKDLHPDIVFSIIADDDDIALPFLHATPALNHWHMLAVLRVGDEIRRSAIARRPDISDAALTFIINSGSLELCLIVLCNSAVQFGDTGYHTLYDRFGQAPEMVDLLLSRSDLPLDIRILQAKRASDRMHQLMSAKTWIPANDAAELVADAEETAILRILVDASNQELARAIPFLVSKNMLIASIIVRSAAIGEMRVVQWSLAHLAGVSLSRAHELMYGRGFLGFKSLHSKSGLPQSCLGILQAACDVAKDMDRENVDLDPEKFGRCLIEALMTRYENMNSAERAKNLEFIGRFAEDRVRQIAKRLKADIARAA
jgi:uncharacterized protein (DUF2336 family)